MNLRTSTAVLSARLVSLICRAAGNQGVTLAGKIAMKIDPGILRKLSAQVNGEIIVTCGTNGKTTTNNLICRSFESEGRRVVCNRTGSNMLYGVASAFVLSANIDGSLRADNAVIEIDEASASKVFSYFSPGVMVLTNLFRDQLDRYGEIDITMELLKKAIDMAPSMTIIVNGDDSLSAYLALESGHSTVTFGISERVEGVKEGREVREGQFCKRCGSRLKYDFYHYGQLGIYRCETCGFCRPAIDYTACHIDMSDSLNFDIKEKGAQRQRHIKTNCRGFYNIYNILACYAAVRTEGLNANHFNEILDIYAPENGRNELFHIGNSEVLLNLAKNPAGFNQNIASVMMDRKLKDLIIVINDNAQDGTDISWLWDVDFDLLDSKSIRSITVSGLRCLDMRLRLKYVSIKADLIPNTKMAIRARLKDGCGNLYVLVNYTALYRTRKILKHFERGLPQSH